MLAGHTCHQLSSLSAIVAVVRAGRLVQLLRLLQARGRMTVGQLAAELEVSQRTVFRDIEALSGAGVPVYAVRGSQGGVELLDRPAAELPVPGDWSLGARPSGRVIRATVRLSPQGRRLAALLGRPAGVRIGRNAVPAEGREDWVEASVRIDSVDAALHEMLALGAEVEVLRPPELRTLVRDEARGIAELHAT